jgi:hypothetical protein
LRRDNDHIAATAKMAVLIVAAFPSRLSRYTMRASNDAQCGVARCLSALPR